MVNLFTFFLDHELPLLANTDDDTVFAIYYFSIQNNKCVSFQNMEHFTNTVHTHFSMDTPVYLSCTARSVQFKHVNKSITYLPLNVECQQANQENIIQYKCI